MVRSIWALINAVVWLVILGAFVLVGALLIPFIGLTKAQRLTWRIACIYFRICLWASSVSYTVIGTENLDPEGNYFFACNHQSDYDIPLVFAVVLCWLISVAKSSISYIPIFGWAVALGGTIFIQRSNHKKALSSLDDGCKTLRKRPRRAVCLPCACREKNITCSPFVPILFECAYVLCLLSGLSLFVSDATLAGHSLTRRDSQVGPAVP
jgi:1-acyl-sn-glycerol-3-phosphate acyltransferase